MHRSRRLAVPAIVLATLAVTSCQWAMLGFDAGRSGVNPGEHTIDTANVGSLTEQWRAASVPVAGLPVPSPIAGPSAVANGIVFVTQAICCSPVTATLFALPEFGAGCTGGPPAVCAPLWRAKFLSTPGGASVQQLSAPVVEDGVVYVAAQYSVSDEDRVFAFDATGTTGCSGSPKTCQPLWSAPGFSPQPFVDHGELFVFDRTSTNAVNNVLVYDAAGSNGCSGSPTTCAPLFRMQVECGTVDCVGPQSMAAMDGKVYFAIGVLNEDVTHLPDFFVFSEDGTEGCSGAPKVCEPLSVTNPRASDSTVATQGYVISIGSEPNPFNGDFTTITVDAPDPANSWFTVVDGVLAAKPAVTGSTIYLPTNHGLTAFTLTPACGSSCQPCVAACQPLWQATSANSPIGGAATVANGVVYDERGRPFDAAGSINCGGTPKVCTPLSDFGTNLQVGETQVVSGWVFRMGQFGFTAWSLPS